MPLGAKGQSQNLTFFMTDAPRGFFFICIPFYIPLILKTIDITAFMSNSNLTFNQGVRGFETNSDFAGEAARNRGIYPLDHSIAVKRTLPT